MEIVTEPKSSKSAILTYDSCPYKYNLQYIMKLQQTPSPILQRGLEIHELCDGFYDGVDNIVDAVEQLSTKEKAIKYQDQMKILIDFTRHFGKGKFRKPIMKENKFFNEKYNFTVIADAIFEDENGDLYLIDYKTGRNRGIAHHRFELATYVYFMEKELNRKIKYWGILFLDDNQFTVDESSLTKTFDFEEVIPNEIDKALIKISNTRKKINMEIFPRKSKYGCRYCGYFGNGCSGI